MKGGDWWRLVEWEVGIFERLVAHGVEAIFRLVELLDLCTYCRLRTSFHLLIQSSLLNDLAFMVQRYNNHNSRSWCVALRSHHAHGDA